MSRATVLVAVMTFVATSLIASPAWADPYDECNYKWHHDSQRLKVRAIFDHPSGSPDYARAMSGGGDGTWWQSCTSSAEDQGGIVDIWNGVYVDNLINGSYTECRRNVHGWHGNDNGWKIDTVDESALDTYCRYHSRKVRVRALGKARYSDGHIITQWTYTSAHSPV